MERAVLSKDAYAYGVSDGQVVGQSGQHAALWTISTGTMVDLNQSGWHDSVATGASAGQQAGNSDLGATLWSGTAASAINLTPAGYSAGSYINGIGGGQEVGNVYNTTRGGFDAALWSGTAASFVDLNNAGWLHSDAEGVKGGQQVGSAYEADGHYHPGMWTGSAASWVDMMAPGATDGGLNATDGVHQVGEATFAGKSHAGIWSGTAASFFDLDPAQGYGSVADALWNGVEAGWIDEGGSGQRACAWFGSAASFVDLQSVLPASVVDSQAFGVWGDGKSIYVAGYAFSLSSPNYSAILWTYTPAPEPAPFVAFGAGVLVLLARRRLKNS